MKAFFDVDDTLIIYNDSGSEVAELLKEHGVAVTPAHPYGIHHGTPYTVNVGLVEYIKKYAKAHPDALIVIWSGGGREYAQEAVRICGLEEVADLCMIKDRSTYPLVEENDLVVDDQPLEGLPVEIVSPKDFL